MSIYLKYFIFIPIAFLYGCEQSNFLCKNEDQRIAELEQILASKIPAPPAKNNNAELRKQLEQVTTDLVKVKIP